MTSAFRSMLSGFMGLACYASIASGQVFISQYYEGTSNNKWVELYNAGDDSVDLGAGGYQLGLWSNANRENWKINDAPSSTMSLIGTMAPGATFVIGNTGATNPVYAIAHQTNSGVIGFNGDDSLVLYLGATYSTTGVVDSIGLTNNSLADTSIVRKSFKTSGNTGTNNLDLSEWDTFTFADVNNASPGTPQRLGFHLHDIPSSTRYVALGNPTPLWPYTSWATAATNIQDVIDISIPGELILVSNGVYQTGGRVVSGMLLTNRLVIHKPVTVQSVNGPAVTIIRGAKDPLTTSNGVGAIRCVWMTNGATLVGFTLTNGATRTAGVEADLDGGGLWAQSASVVVSNAIFTGNSAIDDGGGAYGGTLNYCQFIKNRAAFGGGAGFFNNPGVLNNCMLTANEATSSGGGTHLGTLNNCTLSGNSATVFGGGAAASRLNNSIVYFNTGSTIPTANHFETFMTNSCTTPFPSGTGNTTNNPRFVNVGASNYRLEPNSPCRDAGDSSLVIGATDLDGRPRIFGAAVDMGAYEFITPPDAITGPVSNITDSTATLTASILAEGLPASYFFEYEQLSVFSSNSVTIPSIGTANPYPSTIAISDLSLVTNITVTLIGLTHTFPADLDILLVGPQGESVVLMSDAGGGFGLTNRYITFDDTASQALTTNIINGSVYRPTNIIGGDPFAVPASTNQLGTNLAVFAATDPNGIWSLFVVDDASGDSGSLQAWSLSINGTILRTITNTLPATGLYVNVSQPISGLTSDALYRHRIVATNAIGPSVGLYEYFYITVNSFADADGDGISDEDEAIAGTDPANPNSVWEVGGVQTDTSIQFGTVIGRLYAVERNDTLFQDPQVWIEFTNNIPGTGGPIAIMDPMPGTNRNYRVRVQLAP